MRIKHPWAAEALGAAALLIWRTAALPLFMLWRDWIAILSLYWLCTLVFRRERFYPALATSVAAFLLGLYVFGQAPHALGVIRPQP